MVIGKRRGWRDVDELKAVLHHPADRSVAGMKDKGKTLPLSSAYIVIMLWEAGGSFPTAWPFPAKAVGLIEKAATEIRNV